MNHLTNKDYDEALLSQSACNISGIVFSFSTVLDKIWKEAREFGKGTDWVNNHPICRLYAEQISHLSRGRDYTDAYAFCDKRRK